MSSEDGVFDGITGKLATMQVVMELLNNATEAGVIAGDLLDRFMKGFKPALGRNLLGITTLQVDGAILAINSLMEEGGLTQEQAVEVFVALKAANSERAAVMKGLSVKVGALLDEALGKAPVPAPEAETGDNYEGRI